VSREEGLPEETTLAQKHFRPAKSPAMKKDEAVTPAKEEVRKPVPEPLALP
jgi:hypothetical protein